MRKVVIILFGILGMIVGIGLGEFASSVSFLEWLSIGGEIGLKNPVTFDLNFLQLTIGIWCKVSIAGVIGMVSFALLSQRICKWIKL